TMSRPSESNFKKHKLLLGGDRILGSLGDAEFHHGLRLDLDRFAGLRIPSNAGFAMRFHQTAEARHNEHAVLLGFFHGDISELLQEQRRSLVGKFSFLRQMTDELSLGQT